MQLQLLLGQRNSLPLILGMRVERWASNYAISHSSEQGTIPTSSLISKQAVPYQTRGDTYCPGVSTPMTQPLADSSMTNHIT
jgi:hypothetical protein